MAGRSEVAQGSGPEPGQVRREGRHEGRRWQSVQGLGGPSLGSGLHPKGRGGALAGESALTSAPEGGLADEGAWGSRA